MSASHHRWCCRLIAVTAIVVSITGPANASQRAGQSGVPDQSVLDPATQALDKAVSAHADKLAPRIVDSARRRLTVARDILFKAAENDRALTAAENSRIQTLVDQARLDARAALTKTQAVAIRKELDQLQGNRGNDQNGAASGPAADNPTTGGDGLEPGVSSLRSGSNQGSNTLGGSQ